MSAAAKRTSDPIAEFRDALRARGIIPPVHIIADGKIHRCDTAARNGKDDAAYLLHIDGAIPAGGFENHQDGLGWENWRADIGRQLSAAERAELAKKAESDRKQREHEERRRQIEAQSKARHLFDKAYPAEAHPYLIKKGIGADRARTVPGESDKLLIPVEDENGVLYSLQIIDEAGGKKFLPGGAVRGRMCRLGDFREPSSIIVCEGFATGASLHEASGIPVAVAFDCGNLRPVCEALRRKYATAKLILAADDDHLIVGNPGLNKAREAKEAVAGVIAVPDFGDNRPADAKDFNDLARLAGYEAVKRCIGRALGEDEGNSAGDDWPDPEPLVAPENDVRPYPLDALPPIVADAVAEHQAYGQQPLAMVACSALAAASLAAQGLADVRRDDRLTSPIGLFFAVVAVSGERKSSADREFARAIRDWVKDERERLLPDVAKARAGLTAWQAECDGLIAKIKAASGGKSAADIFALRSRLAELEAAKPSIPIVPALFHEDTNPAALAVDLAEGWPSASLWSDEAGLVVGSHGMKDETLVNFIGLLNRLWDGQPFDRRRRTAVSCTITGRRFTACLMMQPIVLNQLLAAGGGASRGMGLIARCLMTWPASTIGTRPYRQPPESMPNMTAFHRRLRELLDMPLPAAGNAMELRPPVLPLSDAAFRIWCTLHDDIERELGTAGEFEGLADIGAKAAENAARLAGLFHVIEVGPIGEVSADAMKAAAKVAVWHLHEARRILGRTERPQAALDAEALLKWCLARPEDGVATRDISRLGPNQLRDRARRDAAIALLAETSHARLTDGVLHVNPKTRERR